MFFWARTIACMGRERSKKYRYIYIKKRPQLIRPLLCTDRRYLIKGRSTVRSYVGFCRHCRWYIIIIYKVFVVGEGRYASASCFIFFYYMLIMLINYPIPNPLVKFNASMPCVTACTIGVYHLVGWMMPFSHQNFTLVHQIHPCFFFFF